MGEANDRGTYEERLEEALWRDAEVIVFLRAKDNTLSMGVMPQRDEPDQDGMAMIFAGFLNANFPQLLKMAQQAYQQSRTAIPTVDKPALVKEATPRIIGADGPASAEVKLVGPDGSVLQ